MAREPTVPVQTLPARGDGWLAHYLAATPRAVAVVTGAAHIVVETNAAFRILGTGDEAPGGCIVGRPIAEGVAPTAARALTEALDHVRASGEPADWSSPSATRDGWTPHWRCSAWAAHDDAGVPVLVLELRRATAAEQSVARHREVNERVLLGALQDQEVADAALDARHAAERREAELAAVLESIPDAIVIRTHDHVLRVNGAALALLGVTSREELEREWPEELDAATGAPIEGVQRSYVRALAGATVMEHLVLRHRGTGVERTVRCAAAPVVVDGVVVAAVVVKTDVTVQRALEAQLRQSQKLEAIGRLAGGVAHDFNNLLATIGSNAELVAMALPPASGSQADLREIHGAVERARTLTQELLAFSRQQAISRVAVDVGVVVTDLTQLLTRTLGGTIRLTTRLAPALPTVVADRGQVEQVLMNLAINARDAMPEGGTLEIGTACTAEGAGPARAEGDAPCGWVTLTVRDSGAGMDDATRARIFEPFFTTKPQGRGTGLGLATVYGIVAQSRGHIAVDSVPGAGTTFTIHLPAAPAAPAAPPASAACATDPIPAAGSLRPARPDPVGGLVLLVDDDATVRSAVARLLVAQGFTVLQAPGGAEALALAARHASGAGAADPIRALVSDVMMPGMRGPELAERLLATMPGLRVLFISGYAPGEVVPPGTVASTFPRLEKPFTGAALGAALRQLLDGTSRAGTPDAILP